MVVKGFNKNLNASRGSEHPPVKGVGGCQNVWVGSYAAKINVVQKVSFQKCNGMAWKRAKDHQRGYLSMEISRLTRDGTAEPVSRDQILRRERGREKKTFTLFS